MSIHMLKSRELQIRKYDDGAAEQYMDISEALSSDLKRYSLWLETSARLAFTVSYRDAFRMQFGDQIILEY